MKFCRKVKRGSIPSKKVNCSESSRLSLTTLGSSINAAFGGVSAGGLGNPEFDVTHSGGGPCAFVATQFGGSVGGVTPSKFSVNVSRTPQNGHGGVGDGLAAARISTRRARRAALFVGEKKSCLIQGCPTPRNIVTQLRLGAP